MLSICMLWVQCFCEHHKQLTLVQLDFLLVLLLLLALCLILPILCILEILASLRAPPVLQSFASLLASKNPFKL